MLAVRPSREYRLRSSTRRPASFTMTPSIPHSISSPGPQPRWHAARRRHRPVAPSEPSPSSWPPYRGDSASVLRRRWPEWSSQRGCSCPLKFAPVKTELTHDRPDGPKFEIASAPVRDCGPPSCSRITPFPMRAFQASWNLNTTESFQLGFDLPVLHEWDTRYSNQIGSACGSCRTFAGSSLP